MRNTYTSKCIPAVLKLYVHQNKVIKVKVNVG